MQVIFSIHWFLIAAIWYTVNGFLHDIFVIRAHKGPYDRELLRLLLDGHVLIFSGLICFVGWLLVKQGNYYGPVIGIIAGLGMILYCLLIFPFLKSFVTLFLSIFLVLACIYQLTIIKIK